MMDNIFLPNTGDEKMDEAYKRFKSYVDKHDDFSSFFDAFMKEVKTDDEAYLRRWLLKILFAHLKHKHPFDVVYDEANEEYKKELDAWIKRTYERAVSD